MSWFDNADDLLAKEKEDQAKKSEAERWNPEEGEILKGTLLDVEKVWYDGTPRLVLTVDELGSDRVLTVWASNKVLADAVATHMPAIGAGIMIQYEGFKEPKTKNGRRYKMFYLQCEASDGELYERLAKMPEPERNTGAARPSVVAQYEGKPTEAPF